jgi:hypothetical protein
MSSRKKKKPRKQKKARHPQRPAFSNKDPFKDVVLVHSPPGEAKMSEVLLEFVEPYSESWSTEEQLQKLLTVALVAWNAAILPESKRDEFILDMVNTVPPDARRPMLAIIAEMMQRKLQHFAGNKRMILNFEVTSTPSGPHVSVMSTLTNE